MQFDEYQKIVAKYDCADFRRWQKKRDLCDGAFVEKILGLSGEAGETADKFKKLIRDKNGVVSEADKMAIAKELGDVLWYVASIARYMDMSLSEVAILNMGKLADRAAKDTLHGSGDNR